MRHLTDSRLTVLCVVACILAGFVVFCASGQAQGAGSEDAQALLDQARKHFSEDNYVLAKESCERAIATHPEAECYARLVLAEVYADQGRLGDAIREAWKARHAAAAEPADADGVEMAQATIDRLEALKERFEQRPAELEKKLASATGPEEIVALSLRLGDAYAFVGKTEKAAARYRAVVDMYPERPGAASRSIGRLRLVATRTGGTEEAAKTLQAVAAAHPGTPAELYAVYYLGTTCESEGDLASAMAYYEDVVGKAPGSESALKALQRLLAIHQRLEQLNNALEMAERIVREYPQSPSALSAVEQVGQVSVKLGRLEDAKTTLRDLIRRDPESSLALRSLAVLCNLYAGADGRARAIEILEAVQDEYPGRDWRSSPLARVFYRHGHAMNRKGDFASAAAWWEEEARLERGDEARARAIFRIAVSYGALEQWEKVRQAMNRILASSVPAFRIRHCGALQYVAATYLHEGDRQKALEVYREALDLAVDEGRTRQADNIRKHIESLRRELRQQGS